MPRGGKLWSGEAVARAGPGAGGLSPDKLERKAHQKGRSFCGAEPRLAFLSQSRKGSSDSNPWRELEVTGNLPADSGRLLARPWPTRSTADLGWLASSFAAGMLPTEVL